MPKTYQQSLWEAKDGLASTLHKQNFFQTLDCLSEELALALGDGVPSPRAFYPELEYALSNENLWNHVLQQLAIRANYSTPIGAEIPTPPPTPLSPYEESQALKNLTLEDMGLGEQGLAPPVATPPNQSGDDHESI